MFNKKRGFTPLEVRVHWQKHKKNKLLTGFTLIEILVAVAIIGILAGLIIVGLNSARKAANRARALTEFNQITLAMQLFYDKNGRWPNYIGDEGILNFWREGNVGYQSTDQPEFVSEFHSGLDGSYYCSTCVYSFHLYDADIEDPSSPGYGKPDCGYIRIDNIARGSTFIQKYTLCLTDICGDICGDVSYSP